MLSGVLGRRNERDRDRDKETRGARQPSISQEDLSSGVSNPSATSFSSAQSTMSPAGSSSNAPLYRQESIGSSVSGSISSRARRGASIMTSTSTSAPGSSASKRITGASGAAYMSGAPALLPEEMRAIQRQREREKGTLASAERQRDSLLGSQESQSSSRNPYSSNHMESSVTRLLVATKLLLEALTHWSVGQRSETDVSDVYVRLGNDFHSARIAFHSYGIDMSDLTSVPDDLRGCLERCLSEEASPAILDQHLPRVREIIVRLLQGLKLKQAEYKRILVSESQHRTSRLPQTAQHPAEAARPVGPRSSRAARQERRGTGEASNDVLPFANEGIVSRQQSVQGVKNEATRNSGSGTPSAASSDNLHTGTTRFDDDDTPIPSSNGSAMQSSSVPADVVRHSLIDQPATADQSAAGLSSLSTAAGPNSPPLIPAMQANSASLRPNKNSNSGPAGSRGNSAADLTEADPNLRALKSRDALERRASKRFSAYTFNKMGLGQGFGQSFGSGSLGMSLLSIGGGSGNSPNPEQGRVQRHVSQKQRSKGGSISESNLTTIPQISGLPSPDGMEEAPEVRLAPQPSAHSSTAVRTKGGATTQRSPMPRRSSAGSATSTEGSQHSSASSSKAMNGQLPPVPPVPPLPSLSSLSGDAATGSRGSPNATRFGTSTLPVASMGETSSHGATTQIETHQLQVFLQLGRQTRKASVDTEGGLSMATLKMLFLDRFAYSPGKDDFPAIYIKDPLSGVTYELEDLQDVTEGCLLTLNIEPLDQVKQHLDLSLGAITRELREVKTALLERDRELLSAARRVSLSQPAPLTVGLASPIPASPSKFSDSQFAAAGQRVASFRAPSIAISDAEEQSAGDATPTGARIAGDLKSHYDEIQNLRREMAILRQLQTSFTGDVGGLLQSMKEQTRRVRAIAATEIPAERNFIVAGKSRLDGSSQEVLTLIEDLQDVVDDLKLDVIQRGVKPKPATLKKISDNIVQATRGLEDLEKYVQTVKPSWKKTWEAELQNIVDEQEFLNHQEGLIGDLRDDHIALQEVYESIQQVVKLRSAGRPAGGKYIPPAPEEGHEGLSTVMLEVRGQSVDHEKRLRALQAAERQRQREIASRTDDFSQELSGFVQSKAGDGLRKTGGHIEAERIRSKRDKATLLAMFGAGGAGGAPMETSGMIEKPKKLILGASSSGGVGNTRGGAREGGGSRSMSMTEQRSMSTDSRSATSPITSQLTGTTNTTATTSEEGAQKISYDDP